MPDPAVSHTLVDRPRVLVAGAGSLGSVYGAHLARAGARVVLLARERHAAAIAAQRGVWVDDPSGRWLAPLEAVVDPAAIGTVDVLLLLTKTPDTLPTLSSLDHLRDSLQLALSLQNGVRKDEQLAAWCGPERVVGAVSLVGGSLVEPGHVHRTVTGPTYLGELDGTLRDRTSWLATLLEAGGLPVEVTPRIASAAWSKLAQAVAAMSLSVMTRRCFHELLLDPDLAATFVTFLREVATVAAAEGVTVDDWPGMLPVRSVCGLDDVAAAERLACIGRDLVRRGETNIRISMLQSLERGAPLEVDAVQPWVAQRAAGHGLSVPAVELAARVVVGLERLRVEAMGQGRG